MNKRPTPEQIASTYKGGVRVLRRLEQYGYRIEWASDEPEPFEAFLHYGSEQAKDPENGYWYVDMRANPDGDDDDVWKVTVTPIERAS